MIESIVSGAQTGADRAALDIAIELNIEHHGWCPKGRSAEDGIIDCKYNVKESDSADVSVRTKLNIRDSDGTLIFVPSIPIRVTDGTTLTIKEVYERKKPYLIIDFSQSNNINDLLKDWVRKHNIKILNVAGPRESQYKGTYQAVRSMLKNAIAHLNNIKLCNLSPTHETRATHQKSIYKI